MNAVQSPNLPKKASAVIIGERYRGKLQCGLNKLQIETIWLPDNPHVDPRLSGHADLSLLHIGGKMIIAADYLKGSAFADKLYNQGFKLYFPGIDQGAEYPKDAALNLCLLGETMICGKNIVTPLLVNDFTNFGFKRIIKSRQGYARCACCVVDDNSIITADRGIYKAATENGLNCLLISPGFFELTGFEYGFIGGSSFKLGCNLIAFTGRLDEHPDKERIMKYLSLHNIDIVYITQEVAFDIGTAIPISEA